MSEREARQLKPGQVVIQRGDPNTKGTVLGILRKGVNITWRGDRNIVEVKIWAHVGELELWQSK